MPRGLRNGSARRVFMLSRSFPVSRAASMRDSENGSAQSCATLSAVGRFEAFLSARFDSAISLHNAGQLYPQPPDAWGPSPHRQHLLSGFFFSMSHAFFHNSRAGILSAPFLARRMCVNKAPRPQTRGFFNAMWPPERSLERVSAEILLAGSSPRAVFYIPVAQEW